MRTKMVDERGCVQVNKNSRHLFSLLYICYLLFIFSFKNLQPLSQKHVTLQVIQMAKSTANTRQLILAGCSSWAVVCFMDPLLMSHYYQRHSQILCASFKRAMNKAQEKHIELFSMNAFPNQFSSGNILQFQIVLFTENLVKQHPSTQIQLLTPAE